MTQALPQSLTEALDARRPSDHGTLRALDGAVVVAWSPDEVRGLAHDGDEPVVLDAQGVLPVQLSRGHGEHAGEDGFVGRLKALWSGPRREALFVELRGRHRVRVHAPIDAHPALARAAESVPELRLEGSREVEPEHLLDLLAALRLRGSRFLLGAPSNAAPSGRPVVDDDEPAIAGLPAAAWLPLADDSPWLGLTIGALPIADTAVVVGLARQGGVFVPGPNELLHPGDSLALGTLAGSLAALRAAAGVAVPLRLERARVRSDAPVAELLLSEGAFGAVEHDPGGRPVTWRFAALGDRAGLVVSVVDAIDAQVDTPLSERDWPEDALPVAALGADGQWTLATRPEARGQDLVMLAGDRLAVAEAETRL